MSESNSSIDAALFDRLVDGELDARAQADLLSRLDENPSDWRRLALAFVEAQAFGAEMRGIVAERPRVPSPEARPEQRAPQLRKNSSAPHAYSPWNKLLSLAATMLIAVGIGFGVGRVWQRDNGVNVDQPTNQIVEGNPEGYPEWPRSIAQNSEPQPQGMMTVQAADGSPVELPVYEASYGNQKMLSVDGTSVPPEVIRALRSRGHEVKQQRRLWPIDLGDGRQIIVPVDQVDVQYVGDRAYQ